jgi:hypothetical protein
MTTATLMAPSLRQVLTGLDVLEGLDPQGSSAQAVLAQHLVHQGQAHGWTISEREAALVARMVLTPAKAAPDVGALLSTEVLKTYTQLPTLIHTPSEQQANRLAYWRPQRWIKYLAGVVASGLGGWGLHLGLSAFVEWSNRVHPDGYGGISLLVALMWLVGFGLMVGAWATSALLLVHFLIGEDVDASLPRRKEAYRQQLQALSRDQLTQVHTAVLMMHEKDKDQVHAAVLSLIQTEMATRELPA